MLELDYPREEFEWVIVDDGSQDGTSTVVQDIIRDELISVQFFRQPNLGIHIAQNRAIELAKGRFVTRIDTDDYLLPGALSEMDEIWDAIPPEHKESFVGIVGLTLNPDLSPRCSQLAHATIDCTGVELRRLHGATGDRSFCMRTAVMRSYPIPAYGDTKYVPESIVWRRIDREYVTRFSNAAFSVCSFEAEGSMMIELRASDRSSSNALSGYYLSLHALNEFWDQLTFHEKWVHARSFLVNGMRGGKVVRPGDIWELIDRRVLGVAMVIVFPGARLLGSRFASLRRS